MKQVNGGGGVSAMGNWSYHPPEIEREAPGTMVRSLLLKSLISSQGVMGLSM